MKIIMQLKYHKHLFQLNKLIEKKKILEDNKEL
jgi:hypothetical protein